MEWRRVEDGFACQACGADELKEQAVLQTPNGHWDAETSEERLYRCGACGALHRWERYVTRVGLYGDNDETKAQYCLVEQDAQ